MFLIFYVFFQNLTMAAYSQFFQAYPEILLSLSCSIFLYYLFQLLRPSFLPVNWPLVGMLPALVVNLHRLHDWATDLLAEAGCNFSFNGPCFLGMDLFLTSDPANVQHIFNVNFANYPKGEDFLEVFAILGDGIFNADGEPWKQQRMKAHAVIGSQRFRSLVARSIRRKVETTLLPLMDDLAGKGNALDLQDVFLRLTFDSTCYLVFGVDPGCLSVEFPAIPFAKAMDDVTAALFFRHVVPPAWWKLLRWLQVGEEKKLTRAWVVMDEFVADRIAERKLSLRSRNSGDQNADHQMEESNDILSSYITEDGESIHLPCSDKFLRDSAINLMLAGRDTTGAGLSWFIWLVSKHPAVEEKLLEEIESNCLKRSSNGGLITFHPEETGKLVFLHAALCESLRLYPPVPFEHKGPKRADVLPSGHLVRPGTKMLVLLYSIGRMEGVWGEDCGEFRPERWISEKGRVRHEPSYKFMSFNSGPRSCIGKEVAFTQMKAVAAAVLYNFHVQLVHAHLVQPKLSIILQMKNGLQVKLKRRERERERERVIR